MDNDITIEISNIENYTIQLNEQGPQGIAGPPGADGPQGPQGEDGASGVGITGIEKTSTSGLVDTYTITYSDGASSTYEVTNGKDATVNGYNVVTFTASNGISLSQSDDDITISGATLSGAISDIEDMIPSEASSSNKLADKNFVNSSIATNTANFIGTFADVATLEAYSGTVTNNDYAFVVNSVVEDNGNDWASFSDLDDYDKDLLTNFDYAWVVNGSNFDLYRFDIVEQEWGLRVSDTPKAAVTLNTAYNRYKATVSGGTTTWAWEYTLNNSSFTASQWAAINSGATTTNIGQITTNQNAIGTLSSLTTTAQNNLVAAINELNSNKQDSVTFSTGLTDTSGTITVTDYDKLVKNVATGENSLVVGPSSSSYIWSTVFGISSSANDYGTALGYNATATSGIAIGSTANSSAEKAIQIGMGTNSTANTLSVGFNSGHNYQLLDGTNGYIPNARINMDTTPTDSSTNAITSGAVYTALNGKSTVSGTDDGTNWSTITIDGTTKNIPSGGGGSATDVQINGTSIVVSNVANIITETAYNASTNKIATVSDLPDISGKQDKAQAITTLSGTSITLTDNSINTLTPSGNTTFTLPTVTDTTVFHQILVQLNLSTVYTIGLGTTTYFGGTAPDLSTAGNYNLLYEYDNALSAWVVGCVSKGTVV